MKLQNIRKKSLFYILVLILVSFILTYLHYEKNLFRALILLLISLFSCNYLYQKKHSAADIFGISPPDKSKRLLSYDIIRLIAVVCVLATHIIQIDIERGMYPQNHIYLLNVLWVLFMVCNPLYVMISCALLFPWKEEKPIHFYYKRFTTVFIPLAVYYIWYLWQNLKLTTFNFTAFKMIIRNLYGGLTQESPHYWLIYTILSIYIVVPFMRYMIKDMSYKRKTDLAAICFIFLFIETFLNLKVQAAVIIPFSLWLCTGIIGYWVTLPESRKYDHAILISGVISFIAMLILVGTTADFKNLCCNTSPIMVCIALSIIVLCIHTCGQKRNTYPFLQVLSKYSYGIILIHWWAIHWIAKNYFNLTMFFTIGGGILELVTALISSLFVAILLDNMIVPAAQCLFSALIRLLKRAVLKSANRN